MGDTWQARAGGGEPLRSFHTTGHGATGASPALIERRAAIDDLGQVLRTLVELCVATEAPVEDLHRAAAGLREALEPLARQQRSRHQLPSADDLPGGVQVYNPVCGSGSPLAPPLSIQEVAGTAIGSCTLSLAYEGPPGYAHGGVSALLLDQLLGYAVSAGAHAGMTVELVTRYRAPVPLLTRLHLAGRVVKIQGRSVTAHGWIAEATAPDSPLVEATGVFVQPSREQARRLFDLPGDGTQ